MKKIILVLAVFVATFSASAQRSSSCTILGVGTDQWRGIHRIDDGSYRHHFSSLEVGFNGLVEPNDGNSYSNYPSSMDGFMDLNMGRSMSWTFNLVAFGTRISRDNTFGVSAALGLTVNDYAFQTPTRMGIDRDKWIVPVETDEYLQKSKLNTVAIHIPVVFELNTRSNFFVSAGVFADLVIGSHFKSKFPKEKLRTTYTNFGQFGVTARMGWRDFYVFGNYGFADLINYKHGPELRPFSFGVGLGF